MSSPDRGTGEMAGRRITRCQSYGSMALRLGLEGPFTVSDQRWHPGCVHFHHHLSRLPSGRLILSIGKERDTVDQERFLLVSDDQGHTWSDADATVWPPARYPGFGSSHWISVNLGRDTILTYLNMTFATADKGWYQVPMWVSSDGGQTWGSLQPARVEIPGLSSVDVSGANSHMVEVAPNRLLYVFSCYNRDDGGADAWYRTHGNGRALGCFVEVETGC